MNVNVTGAEISKAEIDAYIERGRGKYSGRPLAAIDIHIDGDFVDITYYPAAIPFHRIRRITGYLVGTTEQFNDAKRAEERERVKHSLCCSTKELL